MDIPQVLINIFGEYPSNNDVKNFHNLPLDQHIKELTKWLESKLLPASECGTLENPLLPTQEGCLGPAMKILDIGDDIFSTVHISNDRLTVQSTTAFSTVKSNCCVYKGKWMYELQLRSKGIMQIGWCSANCKFTQDTGVGDTRNSYGLDGSKQRLWHVHTRKYGPYWRSGDIIGVCLDMDAGIIDYHRNGIGLGEAFNNIERGAGIALFPAISLAFNDSVTLNFGGSPFRHPVKGFAPLQAFPESLLKNADFLLKHIVNLARVISMHKLKKSNLKTETSIEYSQPSPSAVHMVVAGVLINELSNFIHNSYVIEDKAFTYIRSMCVLRSESDSNEMIYPGSEQSTLGTFLTLLWAHLDIRNMRLFVNKLAMFLSSMYRETPVDLDYEKQRMVIVILSCLCNHPMTRKYLIEQRFFKKNCLPVFLYIKPPDESTLGELLPDDHVWTEGLGGSNVQYIAACKKLNQCTDILYNLQKNLVEKLLDNSDDANGKTPSSRKIFIYKLRKYVVENSIENRAYDFIQGHYTPPTQPAVALSFLCIVLDVLQQLYQKNRIIINDKNVLSMNNSTNPTTSSTTKLNDDDFINNKTNVNPRYFYNGTLLYSHYDRLGGILSHLKKTFHNELVAMFDDEEIEVSAIDRFTDNLNSIYSTMFVIGRSAAGTNLVGVASNVGNGNGGVDGDITTDDSNGEETSTADTVLPTVEQITQPSHSTATAATTANEPVKPGSLDAARSINELLDCCIMYYYAVAHKYIIMIADLRDNIGILSDILIETKNSYEDVKRTIESVRADPSINSVQDDILNELNEKFDNRKNVFAQRSIELARKQAWYRSVALGTRRRNLLAWMLRSVFNTLMVASNDGELFAFVPEVYVNILPILLDTVLDFSHHDLQKQYDLSDSKDIIQMAAEFLGAHSADSRIVLASCKDALLQALGTLTCHETGVSALENSSSQSQLSLVHALLRPYENRAWGQSNWLFIRFWLGKGFAFRDARPPSVWQCGIQQSPQGLYRSRGKSGSHAGLLHHIAPAYPSLHFHKLIGKVLTNDEPFSTIFINSILSQLNWAFSEFISLIQEIQNNAQRQDHRIHFESRQLKICSMCFELTVSLMRSLDMLLNIAPAIFKDPHRSNSDLLLNRVCQLISQVLARVTVPPGCFQFVIDLCLPDLTVISHFSIITAAIGILLSLLSDEINVAASPCGSSNGCVGSGVSGSKSNNGLTTPPNSSSENSLSTMKVNLTHVPRVVKMLLTDPSFQIASLQFALGEKKQQNVNPRRSSTNCSDVSSPPLGNFDPQTRGHIDPLTNEIRINTGRGTKPDQPIIEFNLMDYTTHVEDYEIKKVRQLIDMLSMYQSIMSDVTLPSDESICPICYSKSVSATFEPCKHQSCSNCIVQHLMNNKLCFYCKAQITRVINFDGENIYESVRKQTTEPANQLNETEEPPIPPPQPPSPRPSH